MSEITVQELKNKIDGGERPFILDVREPFEKYQSDISYDHKVLIPIGDLPDRLDELEAYTEQEIVCLCRSGSRSAQACAFLRKRGYSDVKNLKGGINSWAKQIDTSLPVY